MAEDKLTLEMQLSGSPAGQTALENLERLPDLLQRLTTRGTGSPLLGNVAGHTGGALLSRLLQQPVGSTPAAGIPPVRVPPTNTPGTFTLAGMGNILTKSGLTLPVIGTIVAGAAAVIFSSAAYSAAIAGLGKKAAGLIAPGPGNITAGGLISGAGRFASPLISIYGRAFLEGLGDAVDALESSIQQVARDIREVSPHIRMAEARTEITRLQRRLERSRILGPSTAQAVEARARLEIAIEDIKLQFQKEIIPLVASILDKVSDLAEFAARMAEALPLIPQTTAELGGFVRDHRLGLSTIINTLSSALGLPGAGLTLSTLLQLASSFFEDSVADARAKRLRDLAAETRDIETILNSDLFGNPLNLRDSLFTPLDGAR